MGIEMTILAFTQLSAFYHKQQQQKCKSQTRLWISSHVLDSALCNIFPKKSDRSRIYRRLQSREEPKCDAAL